jgi:hypothetical protein
VVKLVESVASVVPPVALRVALIALELAAVVDAIVGAIISYDVSLANIRRLAIIQTPNNKCKRAA